VKQNVKHGGIMEIKTLKKKTKSGADLEIWLAPFREGHALYKAILKELQGVNFETDTTQRLSMGILSSDAVEAALWPCMGKATYKAQRCTPELFENPEARCDFQEIQEEVISYNIAPFSGSVDSLLRETFRRSTASPTSK
jgi:hypothetical protein